MTSPRSAAATGLPISRTYLEALIEQAIAALDLLDGDVDLEDNGDTELNGDEHDDDGDREDFSGERASDDDPIYHGYYDGLRMLHLEARETDRVAAWLKGRVDSLRHMETCS